VAVGLALREGPGAGQQRGQLGVEVVGEPGGHAAGGVEAQGLLGRVSELMP